MLILDKIKFSYQTKIDHEPELINDLDLKVDNGVIAAITGPNGCGKSTLFRIIIGELAQKSGNIKLRNVNLSFKANHERMKWIGHVHQDTHRSLVSELTVGEILAIAEKRRDRLSFARVSEKHIVELIRDIFPEMLEFIQSNISRPIRVLSGGQRQVIAVLASILGDPDLVLLDEHNSSIDETYKLAVDQIIARVVRDMGKIVLCISHDQEWTRRNIDIVYKFREGKLCTVESEIKH